MIIAQHSYYNWKEPFIRLNRLSVVSFHHRLPVCASCITGQAKVGVCCETWLIIAHAAARDNCRSKRDQQNLGGDRN